MRVGRFAQGSILAGLVFLAIFAIGEVMVRLVKPRILLDDSPVMLATPAMQADSLGAIRFAASTVVRYALATTHGLEFDVRFRFAGVMPVTIWTQQPLC